MRSLHQRLSLGIVASLTALLALVGVLAYPAIASLLKSEFDDALFKKARQLAEPSASADDEMKLLLIGDPPPEFRPGPGAEFFEIRSADGKTVAKSASLGTDSFTIRKTSKDGPVFFNVRLPDGRTGRAVALSIKTRPGESHSEMTLVFARNTDHLQKMNLFVFAGLVGAGVVIIACAGWLVFVLIRQGLRPYALLANRVKDIQVSTLNSRLDTLDLPPEMLPVVTQLNDLMERLEAAFEREKRFSGNAAHELLTPVSELRAAAENALRWRDDPEATERLAEDALESAKNMERLVQMLLELANAEQLGKTASPETFDIVTPVREAMKLRGGRIAVKAIDVACLLPERVVVSGSSSACLSIIQNLIDNAVEYTPEGGAIRCCIEEEGATVRLTIANTNPGIEESDLPQLWEPFWRRDAARTDRSHSGLGLALARGLAVAHSFGITATLPEPGWFQIELTLAAATTEPRTGPSP